MKRFRISLQQYSDFCANADVSPNYHPEFVEYYYAQLRQPPSIVACVDNEGSFVAAYPVLLWQIFPNSLHKRLLTKKMALLGDIGQPEILFPIVEHPELVGLNCFSPTTSPILRGRIRTLGNCSIRKVAIAKPLNHHKVTKADKSLINERGSILFSHELGATEFAAIYARLHAERWGRSLEEYRHVRDQIRHLERHLLAAVLFVHGEPVAANLSFKAVGKRMLYVQGVGMAVTIRKTTRVSSGSILLLKCLQKAHELADSAGKQLRFSFGYDYGEKDYKRQWATPENTLVAF